MHVPHYEPTPVNDDDWAFGIFYSKAIRKAIERWG